MVIVLLKLAIFVLLLGNRLQYEGTFSNISNDRDDNDASKHNLY